MLRADFIPSHFSDKVKCDIQMGSIDRSTKTETSIEYAQFEICAHKWVDVTDGDYGVAVMNDCKYGHRVKNGLISLNLLRSPTYPDKTADRGHHDFTYAVYPHAGEALESDLIKYAYDLNYPVNVVETEAFGSVIESTNEDVIVETVMSDGNGNVVVRLYETKGKPQSTAVSVDFSYKGVKAVNLILENPKNVDISKMEFTPFEIKTLMFLR
jgi:Alpha-mannosidase